MANSVDPDEEQFDLGFHYLNMPFYEKCLCTKFKYIYRKGIFSH